MNVDAWYDYLGVAARELRKAVRWREIALWAVTNASPQAVAAARRIMRTYALRSRRAFAGQVLPAI